ncbi:matrixin family metalloprotease [Microvirga yunnanensis]|uniref:matrixin family metalloprotease n=1 Tax=Microvirga yunnanensis TaxID=2953740 RepID=UPI0021C7218D|nr:matrixin family metalloprotease [Microvirga sp. HBU65207]
MPDYKAILGGYNWNSEPTLAPQRCPIFLTYSFVPDWGEKRFNATDQKLARYALKQWGDACGIRFLETKSGNAEITFGWYTSYFDSTVVAYAGFPELYNVDDVDPGAALERAFDAGGVHFNTQYKEDLKNTSYQTYVLLHEIGHALGLKHPFHTSPFNRKKLSDADDHSKNTVMSYDNGDSTVYPTKLGPLDKLAIREIYGSSKADAKHVAAWSWNKRTETLTQIGKDIGDRVHGTGVKDVIQGRGGNDRLLGHDGADTLNGGTGNDTLYGGDGEDVFVFDSPLDHIGNVDKIIELEEDDSIYLSSAVFTTLPLGQLSPQNFSEYDTPDARGYIVLDDESNQLYFDPDGSGAAEKVLFARFTRNWHDSAMHLSASDFYVV